MFTPESTEHTAVVAANGFGCGYCGKHQPRPEDLTEREWDLLGGAWARVHRMVWP